MTIEIVRGTNDKPVASQDLASAVAGIEAVGGQLFIGYPLINSASGKQPIDAMLVSPVCGVVIFDLVDGTSLGDFEDRQDESAALLQGRLMTHRDLIHKRQLAIPIETITYAPAAPRRMLDPTGEYRVANAEMLHEALLSCEWSEPNETLYQHALSALQNISGIRRSRGVRSIRTQGSRGERLLALEDSIATLDSLQSKAVIETVEGVQRIRGLAGSGKTIVLALKAAYLHAQHPDWSIGVTFNTRSLKGTFRRLINNFAIEQTGEEPNWERLRVINVWGAPGNPERDGVYHEYCLVNGVDYMDFGEASREFGREEAFQKACARAMAKASKSIAVFDCLLVDEAQDLPPEFLRLCYEMLDEHRRLVYAYDELQNLSGAGVPPAETIFGLDANGAPRVMFEPNPDPTAAESDIILEKCYRNSRPILATAHALGFGIYRDRPDPEQTGLVQIFDHPDLWSEVGYRVVMGSLTAGSEVGLERTAETSPLFLEQHSTPTDLLHFQSFATEAEQSEWVANAIMTNLTDDELRYDDIVVINPNPITARQRLGPIRAELYEREIQSHLAGVDTSADVFFQPGGRSVTFTGVFRAKGNEAAMVYVVNAHECYSSRASLALVRNRLFTAMTRSKAWVRVLGVGEPMDRLIEEYERVRDANFQLKFTYPTPAEIAQLQVVHRDMSDADVKNLEERKQDVKRLLEALEAGQIFAADLNADERRRLLSLLGDGE